MIEARLALTGQSAPGPDPLQSLATAGARCGRITGQRRARHPARVTSGSSAPTAASRPRTTPADRSAGPPPARSGCQARRSDIPVPLGREPSRQRRPSDSLVLGPHRDTPRRPRRHPDHPGRGPSRPPSAPRPATSLTAEVTNPARNEWASIPAGYSQASHFRVRRNQTRHV